MDSTVLQALTSRRQVILDNIRDNDEAGSGYRKVLIFFYSLWFSCLKGNLYGDPFLLGH
jgi:hypothetical protein